MAERLQEYVLGQILDRAPVVREPGDIAGDALAVAADECTGGLAVALAAVTPTR